MEISTLNEKIKELVAIRSKIDEAEYIFKALKNDKDKIQEELMSAMKESNLKSWKIADTNENITIAKRTSIKAIDQVIALSFAKENGCTYEEINTKAVESLIKTLDKVPNGFEVKETEYLSIRKPNENAKQ